MVEYNEQTNAEQMTIAKWLKQNLLMVLTMTSVFLGVFVGLGLRKADLTETEISLIAYPGELYMRALKLLILPLIISSLITGCSSINAKLNGKIALRTLVMFFLSISSSGLLGIALGVIVQPGKSETDVVVNKTVTENNGPSIWDSLLDLGRNIVTENIFEATFQQVYTEYKNVTVEVNGTVVSSKIKKVLVNRPGSNTIGIVVFCIIFGSIISTLGHRAQVIKDFFAAIFEISIKMVRGVIWVTPIGLFSIITSKVASITNISLVVSQLGKFIATVILGVLIWQFIVMPLVYFIVMRKNPFKFYLALLQGTLTAFAASSSAAALPINLDIMENQIKIHPSILKFVLPIANTIHKCGSAMFLCIAAIFLAQINGFYLGAGTLVSIWLSATMLSFSGTGVPSAGLVLLMMILTSIGIPTKDYNLLFIVDWMLDRFRTTNNILGDCYIALFVHELSISDLITEIPTQQNTEERNILLTKEEHEQAV